MKRIIDFVWAAILHNFLTEDIIEDDWIVIEEDDDTEPRIQTLPMNPTAGDVLSSCFVSVNWKKQRLIKLTTFICCFIGLFFHLFFIYFLFIF